MPTAFDPVDLAGLPLANRIVMAPLTRRRAGLPDLRATESMREYYAQRATAGLIVSEAIQPEPEGQSCTRSPGLHDDGQMRSWQPITRAVHEAGGHVFAQLMHAGRSSHPLLLGAGRHPVAPSAVAVDGVVRVNHDGPADRRPYPVPRALGTDEVAATVTAFADAAQRAVEAGFDGVELHGAHGYLIQQFLSSSANRRHDRYGGSLAGRRRYALDVVDAVSRRIGPHRTALRISPGSTANGIEEEGLDELYTGLVDELDPALAYLHVLESPGFRDLTTRLRRRWHGTLVLNPHATTEDFPAGPSALRLVQDGLCDLVCFGSLFVSNPDLVRRLRIGAPLAPPDPETFYHGDDRGYVDYPALPA